MKRLLCVALLCAAGCASVPTSAPTSLPAGAPPTALADSAKEHGWQVWIPHFFADLWETFDARIGMDYGFGAHIKLTDLARLGIFDYSDFTLIGVESDILFTIREQGSIAEAFEAAGTATEFVPLASLEGHDAFLVDIEPFAAAIGRFLADD